MHSVIHNCSAFHSTWFRHCENTWVTDSWCQATTTLLIAVCQHQFVPAVTSSETSQACFCLQIAVSAQPLLACSSAEPCSIACAQLNARQWDLVLSGEAGRGWSGGRMRCWSAWRWSFGQEIICRWGVTAVAIKNLEMENKRLLLVHSLRWMEAKADRRTDRAVG